jgi:hypothetical protein
MITADSWGAPHVVADLRDEDADIDRQPVPGPPLVLDGPGSATRVGKSPQRRGVAQKSRISGTDFAARNSLLFFKTGSNR